MTDETHRDRVSCNGVTLNVSCSGDGPLVLLCHGWPETGHSWRHQIQPIASEGWRVMVPDLRGFGDSDAPEPIDAYTIHHLVGDLVALVAAAGEQQAVVIGHDWGANIAWSAALLRPDLFRAVAALSVPFRTRGSAAPLVSLRRAGLDRFYWFYFQTPGLAEAEFEHDPAVTLRRLFYSASGDAPRRDGAALTIPPGGGFLDGTIDPAELPAWLPAADLAVIADAFRRSSFRGGLNYYRNIDRNWELLAPWHAAKVTCPALFIAGSRDPVLHSPIGAGAIETMAAHVPNLRGAVVIEGAGHWIQQERPQQVTDALLAFLASLRS